MDQRPFWEARAREEAWLRQKSREYDLLVVRPLLRRVLELNAKHGPES